jgi:hypothetical protein
VIEFLRAADFCGTKHLSVSIEQFNAVVCNRLPSFETAIEESLGVYRDVLFRGSVHFNVYGRQAVMNVHSHHAALHYLGKKLAIPGAEMAEFADEYDKPSAEVLEETEGRFFKSYTPVHILNEWLAEQANGESDFRNKFIDWCKVNIPKEWGKEKFDPIRLELQKLRKKNSSKAEIEKFLNGHEIFTGTMTPEEAIEDERKMCFIGLEVIVDMNAPKMCIQKSALVYMLDRIHVFTNGFKKEESSLFVTIVNGLGKLVRNIFSW